MSLFLANRGTKLYELEDEKMVSQFVKGARTNKENVWEDGNIGQFWKGIRTSLPQEIFKSDRKWLSLQLEVCIVESKSHDEFHRAQTTPCEFSSSDKDLASPLAQLMKCLTLTKKISIWIFALAKAASLLKTFSAILKFATFVHSLFLLPLQTQEVISQNKQNQLFKGQKDQG